MSQETINIEIAGLHPYCFVEEVDGIINAAEEIDKMIANLNPNSQYRTETTLAMTALQLSLRIKEIEANGSGDNAPAPSSENKEEDLKLAASVEDPAPTINYGHGRVSQWATLHGNINNLFSYLSSRRTGIRRLGLKFGLKSQADAIIKAKVKGEAIKEKKISQAKQKFLSLRKNKERAKGARQESLRIEKIGFEKLRKISTNEERRQRI